MNLHQNKTLFKDAIKITATQMGMLDIYIEKDYWVTFVLYNLYKSSLSKEIVFKGGTALSKCYGLIERFSEDIDIILIKSEGQSDNQLKKKLILLKILLVKSGWLDWARMAKATMKQKGVLKN